MRDLRYLFIIVFAEFVNESVFLDLGNSLGGSVRGGLVLVKEAPGPGKSASQPPPEPDDGPSNVVLSDEDVFGLDDAANLEEEDEHSSDSKRNRGKRVSDCIGPSFLLGLREHGNEVGDGRDDSGNNVPHEEDAKEEVKEPERNQALVPGSSDVALDLVEDRDAHSGHSGSDDDVEEEGNVALQ